MNTLVTFTLVLLALATLGRAIYYQVTVFRSMAWPYADEDVPARTAPPPAGTSMERLKFFMKDPSHRPLRRTWAAAWVWALIFFFILLVWVVV